MNALRCLFVITLIGLLMTSGCQKYGPVSDSTYEYASALYSICNLKDQERLDAFRLRIEKADDVPENEKGWILDIVGQAESGNWSDASARARILLEEQVQD